MKFQYGTFVMIVFAIHQFLANFQSYTEDSEVIIHKYY